MRMMEDAKQQKFDLIVTREVCRFARNTVDALVCVRQLAAIGIRKDIAILEQERAIYRARIEQDSTLLEELKYDDNLEQFARERYRMQRRGEKVYIVE